MIEGAWLVRVLAGSANVHHCSGCGSRMFVKAPSGLCPLCFTRRSLREEHVHELASHGACLALKDGIG